MTRIAVVTTSPLLASGVLAALAGVVEASGWQLNVQSGFDEADAFVIQARDAQEALALHAALPPDLPAVVLGEDLRELATRSASQPRALALLPPDATPAQLRAALAAVLQGLSVRETAIGWPRGPGSALALDHEPLTPRELEVFELIGKGLSNRDVAGVLGISAHTAKYHVGQILAKVGAATRAEAVSCGLKMGLIGL